jgi:hypothetical protein
MKQANGLIALLGAGLILAGVLAGLAVNSQKQGHCLNSPGNSGLADLPSCEEVPSPVLRMGNQPTPTLAPPRSDNSFPEEPWSNELVKGRPVFLKVETDRNEIEVGWANP